MKRKDIFYSTKRNVTIISTVIVFFCLFIFAIITTTLYKSRVFNDVDKELFQQKNTIDKILNPKPYDKDSLFNENEGHMLPPIPPNIIVIQYKGDKLYAINPNPYFDKDTLPNLKNNSINNIVKISSDGYQFRAISVQNKDIKVQLLVNVDSEIQSITQLIKSVGIGLLILIFVSLVLSYFLSSKVIKPVKEAYDKQVFFVQDASHEMKTPLAVIKGKLELLANSWGDTIDDHFEHISKMMSEVRGLEKLNNDLLLLSKEDIDSRINITEFNLKNFIDDISEFYMDLSEIQDKTFEVNMPIEPVIVRWDYSKVKRMVIILIENAFKYTSAKGKITLSFEEINKTIKITVKDTGIGIKQDEQTRIFDRFFRGADVRAKNINGSGIGLSLLRSIAKTLEIKIKLSSEYGKGTEFELLVPKLTK